MNDKNSVGWGLALRVTGFLLPFVGLTFGYLSHSGALVSIFRVIGYPWGWSGGTHYHPVAFGGMGLMAVISVLVLSLRRDWIAAVTVLLVPLLVGWALGYTFNT